MVDALYHRFDKEPQGASAFAFQRTDHLIVIRRGYRAGRQLKTRLPVPAMKGHLHRQHGKSVFQQVIDQSADSRIESAL